MKIAGLFRKLFLFMALLAGLPAIAQEATLTESNNIRIDPEWIKAFGAGSDISSVYDVKTDRNGNIYQTGYFSRYLHLGQQTIAPKCQTGDCSNYFFLSKHDNRGQLLWVRYALGNSRPAAIAFDSKGNIFVAGTVWSRGLRFTSEDTLTVKLDKPNNYDNGIFICKYSREGKVLQTSFHRDTHPQEASGLYLDKQANLYVAGSFHYRSYDRRDEVKRSFLLLKFNKKGKLLWQQKGDTVSTSDASAVHVHKGQAYVTGGYWKEMKLGQHSFTWNYSTNRAFVASFNAKGKLLWATDSIGKPYGVYGKDLASDAKGNLYVYGKTVTDDLFLARLDKAGKPVWAQTTKGRTQYPQQMLLDKNNNIYLCGQGYSAEFSSSGPDRYGYKTGANLDLFLASYSDKGELRWLKAGGGEGTNYCRAIALNKNSLIALGAHNAKLQFNDTILTPRNAHSFWLASFDLKKLEFMDPSPQQPPKPDKNAIAVDPTTCACTQPQEKKTIYPSVVKNLLSYQDFRKLTGWQTPGNDSLYNDLFFYNFTSNVGMQEAYYSLNLLAFEPVRLLHPDRNFGLNLTPCRPTDKSYELPVHASYNYPIRMHRPEFDHETFDRSARAYFEILAEVAQLDDDMILRKLLLDEYRVPDLKQYVSTVNKKYRTSIKINPNDYEASLQNILNGLERSKIPVTDFVLREFVLTSPRNTGKVNATEARRLEEIFSEWDQHLTLAEIDRNLLMPQIRAGLEAKQVGFEVSNNVVRRWDAAKKQPALTSQGQAGAATILLETSEISFSNLHGLEAQLENVCLAPTEITGTSILLHFSQAQLIGTTDQHYNRLQPFNYPLFITDSVLSRNRHIPQHYAYSYDTLLTKFTGLYVPEASFEIPFKNQTLTVKGNNLLLNNHLLSGIIEIPVVPQQSGQTGTVKITVGSQEEMVTLFELKDNFVRLGLKRVKVVEEPDRVLVYFRKG